MPPQRDPWIIGHGIATERPYIIHTEKPRFMAQVLDEGDPDAARVPMAYSLRDGRSLAAFSFYDDIPDEELLLSILRWADEVLARSPVG